MTRNLNRMLSKIMLILFLVQILSVGFFCVFSAQIIQEKEQESVNYILRTYQRNLEQVLTEVDNDLQVILANQEMLTLLSNRSDLQRWHASYALKNVLQENRVSTGDVDAYIVADTIYNGFLMDRSEYISYEDMPKFDDLLMDLAQKDVINSGWTATSVGDKSYLLKYYNYGGTIISAWISEERISQILSYGQKTEAMLEFFVTDPQNRIICSSNPEWDYGELLITDRTDMMLKKNIMNGAYFLVGNAPDGQWIVQSPYYFLILILLGTSFFMMLALRKFMYREVILPIYSLRETSKKIQRGNYSVRPEFVCRNREMAELKEAYDLMLTTILELKMQEYERAVQIKDSEIRYMHMQLKPHFFLNALSTINSMAYMDKNKEIHDFIQVFTENIRYMFRAGLHTVRLGEEMENVHKYLRLQQMFYENSFFVYTEMAENIKDYPVPQMMIHTFIENIFKHVVNIHTFTNIFIVCEMDRYQGENMLKIEVQSTGKKFEPEIIAMINERREISDTGTGIGLTNIRQILTLMYGYTNLMKLENEEPDIAKVLVWIPGKAKEEFIRKK